MFAHLLTTLQQDLNLLPLSKQNKVEIISDSDAKCPIGEKRNRLLELSEGQFVVFIDDDDMVTRSYIPLILEAIEKNPTVDCIGINGVITFNGGSPLQWKISKDYESWHEKDNVYYRTPNHISPVRRDIAMKVKFPADKSFSEDFEYSKAIYPFLKTEAKIEENIYHYKYIEKARK